MSNFELWWTHHICISPLDRCIYYEMCVCRTSFILHILSLPCGWFQRSPSGMNQCVSLFGDLVEKGQPPRWWFQIFFMFTPIYLGRWSNLTHIFQMGWNHQLVPFLTDRWIGSVCWGSVEPYREIHGSVVYKWTVLMVQKSETTTWDVQNPCKSWGKLPTSTCARFLPSKVWAMQRQMYRSFWLILK